MIYHTVYKTVDMLTNEYYIGVHQTTDPNDYYLGSGTRIKAKIKKYGRSRFIKYVLFCFNNPAESYEKEKELVEFHKKDSNCLNLSHGGIWSVGAVKAYYEKQKKYEDSVKEARRTYISCLSLEHLKWTERKTISQWKLPFDPYEVDLPFDVSKYNPSIYILSKPKTRNPGHIR